MSLHRNEIYLCNLKESYKSIITGLHPVLIVSSFKHILKNDTIQVLPITSNIKRICKSHISISGFGLSKESKIMTEMLVTVNKCDLQTFIGKVDNIKMHEINEVLKAHLQLDGKHKNMNAEDLEEIYLMGVGRMEEQRKLNILKSKIKTAYLENENSKCMELLDELIESAKENKFRWFGYYSKSLIYMRYNDMESALKYAKESIKYINEVDIFQQDYSMSLWAICRASETIDKNKAIETYKILNKVYRELNDNKMRVGCLYNTARLQLNVRAMKQLIKYVENINTEIWYFNITKETYLQGLKQELDALKSI